MKVGVNKVVEIQYLGRRLGLDRKTVGKYLQNPDAAGEKNPRASIVDPFEPYLKSRLESWPELSAARLYREISGQERPDTSEGAFLPDELYDGSVRTVRGLVPCDVELAAALCFTLIRYSPLLGSLPVGVDAVSWLAGAGLGIL